VEFCHGSYQFLFGHDTGFTVCGGPDHNHESHCLISCQLMFEIKLSGGLAAGSAY
jgi:hypothetical protein